MSGSTKLFPQHCQLPDMTPHQHFWALTHELTANRDHAITTLKERCILQLLKDRVTALLAPPPTSEEQRVSNELHRAEQVVQQRAIDNSPIITIPRITNAPGIIEACNLTAKQRLKRHPVSTNALRTTMRLASLHLPSYQQHMSLSRVEDSSVLSPGMPSMPL